MTKNKLNETIVEKNELCAKLTILEAKLNNLQIELDERVMCYMRVRF